MVRFTVSNITPYCLQWHGIVENSTGKRRRKNHLDLLSVILIFLFFLLLICCYFATQQITTSGGKKYMLEGIQLHSTLDNHTIILSGAEVKGQNYLTVYVAG